jgi:hypothetical protein
MKNQLICQQLRFDVSKDMAMYRKPLEINHTWFFGNDFSFENSALTGKTGWKPVTYQV